MEPLHEEPSDKDKVKQIVETARNLCAQNKTCVEACDVLHWIEALKNDHAHIVKDVLDQSSSEARRLLVNGAFVYPKEEEYWWQFSIDACHYLLDGTIWSKPLVLAISCRSWKTLKLLLEGEHRASTDVFVRDDGNCNILHALIYSSRCSRPELEQQYVELYRYTMGTLDLETRRTLLMGENAAALRPLEVAVVTAQLDIARVRRKFFSLDIVCVTDTERQRDVSQRLWNESAGRVSITLLNIEFCSTTDMYHNQAVS